MHSAYPVRLDNCLCPQIFIQCLVQCISHCTLHNAPTIDARPQQSGVGPQQTLKKTIIWHKQGLSQNDVTQKVCKFRHKWICNTALNVFTTKMSKIRLPHIYRGNNCVINKNYYQKKRKIVTKLSFAIWAPSLARGLRWAHLARSVTAGYFGLI